MKQHSSDNHTPPVRRAAIALPPIAPATPEEVARLQALREEARRIQQRIGPIDMNAVDLIDLDFYDEFEQS